MEACLVDIISFFFIMFFDTLGRWIVSVSFQTYCTFFLAICSAPYMMLVSIFLAFSNGGFFSSPGVAFFVFQDISNFIGDFSWHGDFFWKGSVIIYWLSSCFVAMLPEILTKKWHSLSPTTNQVRTENVLISVIQKNCRVQFPHFF